MQSQTAWNNFLSRSGSIVNVQSFERSLKENAQTEYTSDDLRFESSIHLKDIRFLFGDTLVLDNINLYIPKNQSVAIVGESGSGKTTLVNILTGLLDLSEGEIYIDGKRVKALNNMNYQKKIGYITQESVIFNDTIFNNVTLWSSKNEDTLKRFNKAIKQASIDDFVQSLPLAEESVLGNNGINLSGGQRQRISIARELYKNIEILIMDEATSALDSETELIIKESIDKLKGQYTILIVAHRLATIRHVDQVIYMKKGRIIKTGTFKDLNNKLPEFKRMVELQEL
jgi:subfamily B ATP-binding cassette protein MsbA